MTSQIDELGDFVTGRTQKNNDEFANVLPVTMWIQLSLLLFSLGSLQHINLSVFFIKGCLCFSIICLSSVSFSR